jgi:hypothetical protein
VTAGFAQSIDRRAPTIPANMYEPEANDVGRMCVRALTIGAKAVERWTFSSFTIVDVEDFW